MTPEQLIDAVEAQFPTMRHEARVAFFSKVISLFGPYVRDNGQFWLDVYDAAERHGVHLLPVHYYSPVPASDAYPPEGYPPRLFGPEFGVDMPPASQAAFLERIGRHAEELRDLPFGEIADAGLRWNNGMFGVLDACAYYAMIRHLRPSTVLEVGSGYSTLFAAQAIARNGSGTIECVEPYPVEFFNRHLLGMAGIALTVDVVQNVPLERFAALQAGDILFIDSSHVVKSGSDVEFLLFRVLPVLKPGVVVHFHDIFLPFGYPRENLERHKRFWNENYLVGAFLAGNRSWEVLVANWPLSTDENLRGLCARIAREDLALAGRLRGICPGGSLWIRRA